MHMCSRENMNNEKAKASIPNKMQSLCYSSRNNTEESKIMYSLVDSEPYHNVMTCSYERYHQQISYAVSLPQFQQISSSASKRSDSMGREQQSRQQRFEKNFTIPFINARSIRFPTSSLSFGFDFPSDSVEERVDAAADKPVRSPSGSEWAFDSINPMKAGSQLGAAPTHGVRNNRTAMSDEIIFPDQIHLLNGKVKNRGSGNKNNQSIFAIANNTTPSCVTDGSTFCEQLDEYPETIIADVVQKKRTQFQTFFGDDVVTNELFNRIDDNLRQTSLCVSREQVIFPKLALNKDDIWKYIVNVNETYRQGIRVEQCTKENKACLFSEFFPRPSKATCKQKYIYRKLIAMNSFGEPEPDAFMFPSCCSCVLEYNAGDLQLRSADDDAASPRAVSALPLGGAAHTPKPTAPPGPDPRRKFNV